MTQRKFTCRGITQTLTNKGYQNAGFMCFKENYATSRYFPSRYGYGGITTIRRPADNSTYYFNLPKILHCVKIWNTNIIHFNDEIRQSLWVKTEDLNKEYNCWHDDYPYKQGWNERYLKFHDDIKNADYYVCWNDKHKYFYMIKLNENNIKWADAWVKYRAENQKHIDDKAKQDKLEEEARKNREREAEIRRKEDEERRRQEEAKREAEREAAKKYWSTMTSLGCCNGWTKKDHEEYDKWMARAKAGNWKRIGEDNYQGFRCYSREGYRDPVTGIGFYYTCDSSD